MQIVIMGGGRVGLNLASILISGGHDITLIEIEEEKCRFIAPELDATVICGSGSDVNILEEVNIENADVFVAASGKDESNLLACILIQKYKVPRIISRINDPNHKKAFENAGIDIVMSPELTAAGYLEKLISRPKIVELGMLGKGNAELLDFTVENGDYVGKRIGDISPDENFIILSIHEKNDIIIPKPDMILKAGDTISILVKTR